MKRIFSLVLFSLAVNFASCQSGSASAGGEGNINTSIAVAEFEQKLAATPGAQIVDVRTPGEFAEGHLAGAVNIDINSSGFDAALARLDKEKPVMVYCLSGGRSSAAARQMGNMGFHEVYNMRGGIMRWRSAGKPLERGNAAPKKTGMTQDDLQKAVSVSEYVLVDYNATWCVPCKKLMPVLQAVAEKKKDKLALVKIDADENAALLTEKGIDGIPYLELYKDGKLAWTHAGPISEEDLLKETGL